MLKVGELFLNLGIKGADKTLGAVSAGVKGMGELKSMSLGAKAAIAGAIYMLQDLMSDSAKMGAGLSNFTALTGMSAQSLQQWQYAARQAGVSGEELTGSLKSVQNAMTNMLLGKGAPEGMAMLANKVGFDPAKARDTLYVMQQLQKFAQQVPQDVGNNMLKSFGLSEGTIAAMRKNAFRPEVFAKAPRFSDKEIGALSKVDAAWANLGQKVQMAFGHMTAKDGLRIVNEISKMTTEVLKLVDAMVKLADRMKIFQIIGKSFEGLAMITRGLTSLTGDLGTEKGREKLGGDAKEFLTSIPGVLGVIGQDLKDAILPSAPANLAPPKEQNIEVNQTLQFLHDGKDSKKTSSSVNKAVKDAFRQLQSQAQGS